MQKTAPAGSKNWAQALKKTFLIMKLAICIVLMTTFQLKASSGMGQDISLTMNNTEIKKVLKTIERDGNFRFLFNSDLRDINKKVSFNFRNAPVKDAMTALLHGTNLTYKELNNNLIVIRSTNPEENKLIKITGRVTRF